MKQPIGEPAVPGRARHCCPGSGVAVADRSARLLAQNERRFARCPRRRPEGGPHVLVVDDDPLFRAAAGASLTAAGYAVLASAGGWEACLAIDIGYPDLVILDCGLEAPSELGILSLMQSRLPHVPVLVMSARRGDFHERLMRAYGARVILSKATAFATLIDHVDRLLASWRAHNG